MQRLHRWVSLRRRKLFQLFIFSWWKTHKRNLPWRRTHDPYKIWVSEVMLQQTQVSRVLPKYKELLKIFPTIQSLAGASPGEVLRAWKGMGYNRRALYLKQTAEIVSKEYKGVFPKEEKKLVQLPGLGTYTARALMVFAFKQDIAMVDTNIRRIITHFFFCDKPQKESTIQKIADQLVPKGKSWEWHQALMDYGSEHKFLIKKIKVKQMLFKDSNRFFRGKIIDRLRENSVSEGELTKEFQEEYKKSIEHIIDGLIKDRLIERKNGMLKLPD